MIYSLTGKLLEKNTGEVVIECGGVGYLVRITGPASGALPPVGENATIYTYLAVSENDVSLYGFAHSVERQMFILLTGVSGVGPKVGLSILGALSPDQIVLAVSAGDHKAFTAASGVGPKLGQRLVLELKDKVAKGISQGGLTAQDLSVAASTGGGAPTQAVAALVSLGYTHSEAAGAVSRIDQGLPVQEIIRLALAGMAKGN